MNSQHIFKVPNDEKSKKKTKSFFEKMTGFPNPKGGKSFYERLTQGVSEKPLPPIGNKKWNTVYVLIIFGLVIYLGIFARTEMLDGRKERNTQERATDTVIEPRNGNKTAPNILDEYNQKKEKTESEIIQLISEINVDPQLQEDLSANIEKCQKIKILNTDHYQNNIEYAKTFEKVVPQYTSALEKITRELMEAKRDATNAVNNLMDAKIDYYQAMLNEDPEKVIDAKFFTIRELTKQLQEKNEQEDKAEDKFNMEVDRYLNSKPFSSSSL